ncbi:hypothetical protein QUF91_15760 [Lysinibacillus sp. G4S2]|nr:MULTISPECIES: hypothetical protein [unclassified Lysinibacillus]MDM5248738.1 hypothetical protein [Lysinibacillus sp. G4S2]
MQIYIPLPTVTFSYEETGVFTTERLKKNRNNKLYLDYVQNREGKTIIAPYSPQGNDKGLIATPLYWEEMNNSLSPDKFTIPFVLERIRTVVSLKTSDILGNYRALNQFSINQKD